MRHAASSVLALGIALISCLAHAASPATPLTRSIDAALEASGIANPRIRAQYATRVGAQIADIVRRVGPRGSDERRAQRLHRLLHRAVLRRFTLHAAGLPPLIDRGEFNCVSATIYWALAARALGLEVHIVEAQHHVYLRVDASGRAIDVEATLPDGFDFTQRAAGFARLAQVVRAEWTPVADSVTLEQAIGYLWHNSAQFALERDDALAAAESLAAAAHTFPDLAERAETIPAGFARAWRLMYESGDFEGAFRIASLDVSVFPHRTSPRDRLLAAALKRVERDSDAHDAAEAEAVLTDVLNRIGGSPDAQRFLRDACPAVVRAAVATGDWDRARRAAARYATVEDDPVLVSHVLGRVGDGDAVVGLDPLVVTPGGSAIAPAFVKSGGATPPAVCHELR